MRSIVNRQSDLEPRSAGTNAPAAANSPAVGFEFRFYTPRPQLTGTSAPSAVTIEARLRGSTKWMITVAVT